MLDHPKRQGLAGLGFLEAPGARLITQVFLVVVAALVLQEHQSMGALRALQVQVGLREPAATLGTLASDASTLTARVSPGPSIGLAALR